MIACPILLSLSMLAESLGHGPLHILVEHPLRHVGYFIVSVAVVLRNAGQ